MKKIVIFNTSYGTLNLGDFIINESVEIELAPLLSHNNTFFIELPTHTPVTHCYQNIKKNKIVCECDNAKYKFLAGTNILSANMLRPWPNWNVNIFKSRPYKGVILVGAGMNGTRKKPNLYTKILLKKILSKDFIHSVRDERTKIFLESLGYKAINTGCATLWSLDDKKCSEIPTVKSKDVVFTLTDYCKDEKRDVELIKILEANYETLYFWTQGSEDYDYLKSLNVDTRKVKILTTLEDFRKTLKQKNLDYVGTRLHAGIYAMQHAKRSIIISIDNRTRDMKKNYNLVSLEREEIKCLNNLINSEFKTDIKVNADRIEKWKKQFQGDNDEK
ncbi:polysaccharide pyruvyl transferase family protein [Candidatus Saccharibacteria bacterium]|nr:polysaccharide pyruvyl transferase family protein [Candidatus Saccharibacteria bacterium]